MGGGLFLKMDGLIAFEKKVKQFNVNQILERIWSRSDVKALIIELNTQRQLYDMGIDSLGLSLGEYTPFTVEQKLFGDGDRRIDHITLKDKGMFYDSFRVIPFIQGFILIANPITSDGTDLTQRFGKDIIGLINESFDILLGFIEPIFNKEAKAALL